MPNDPSATSWSAAGAIMAAARSSRAPAPETPAQSSFTLAMSALVRVVDAGPQSWNDDLGRSQNDVLAALAAALHVVRGEQTANSDQTARAAGLTDVSVRGV
jgi:hypothetical protein